MKKFLSIILCFLFIFLCSCSILPKVTETVNINFEQLEDKMIQSIAINDKYLLIAALDYEDCVGEDAEFSEVDDDPEINRYFYIWNINLNKLKKEYSSTSNEFDYLSSMKLSDDNKITIYAYNDKPESKIYDFNFNEIGTTNETAENMIDNEDKLIKDNKLIDTSRYSTNNNIAQYTNYINKDLIVFLDDDQNIYINNIDKTSNIVDCIGRQVYSISNDKEKEIKFSCTDYENNTNAEINIKYNLNYFPADYAIGNKYSAITLQNEDGQIKDITIINNEAMSKKPVTDIEKININEIDQKIASAESKIKTSYGVDIESFKKYDPDSTISEYIYDNDFSQSELLMTLLDLDYCLSTFPSQLYDEILNRDGDLIKFDKLKLYIIGNFDDEKNNKNINAYCSSNNSEIENELFIVYSVSAFNMSTFYHEFMHAMEYRISENVDYFDNNWIELNPEGFEYKYDDDESTVFFDNEEYQKYFSREYGTTNSLEDRATIFEDICTSSTNNESEPYWAENNEPYLKKAKYLYNSIKKSFPSLSGSDYQLWEIYDSILK